MESAECPLVCICTVCFNLHVHTVRVKHVEFHQKYELFATANSIFLYTAYNTYIDTSGALIACTIGGSLVLGLVIITFLVAVLIQVLMCRRPTVPGGFVHS